MARLTQAQLDDFNKNGYLVLSSLLTTDETNVLRSEAHDVVRNISEGADDKIIHYNLNDNVNSSPHPSPIGSVVAIFESTATIAAAPPIARLGCGIHILLPSFRYWTHHPFHRLLYTDLMPPIARNTRTNPLITQSQIIVKSGDNNGSAIVPHQDGCISFTDPPSCLTYWYALEDSTLENGCLEVLPGSHITEPLRQRVVKGNRGEPKFVDLDEVLRAEGGENEGKSKNEEGIQYAFGLSRDDGAKTRYVPLEVEKGTPVLFHGNLMHKSGKNRGGKGRMAYTFSVIDGEAKTDGDGYMEPEDGHLEKL